MKVFNINKGKIITLNDKENFKENGFEIEVIPAYEYLIQ